jgi:lysophospholipase L1-like esterase
LADYFDTAKINVVNRARGGRSSRTFLTEGLWDQVMGALKPGDYVIMQFGHNDPGPLDDTARPAAACAAQEMTPERSTIRSRISIRWSTPSAGI